METFLLMKSVELTASDTECVTMFVNLAAENLSEEGLARWLRGNYN